MQPAKKMHTVADKKVSRKQTAKNLLFCASLASASAWVDDSMSDLLSVLRALSSASWSFIFWRKVWSESLPSVFSSTTFFRSNCVFMCHVSYGNKSKPQQLLCVLGDAATKTLSRQSVECGSDVVIFTI